MRLYISGPMSGLSDYNRPAFHAAAADLRAHGFDVASPAELEGDDRDPWETWMRKALKLLLDCDAIVFLSGWQDSRGAWMEHNIALALNMSRYRYVPGCKLIQF